mmetsp:Transcript_38528/g.120310  ORF Transcript_38528/g.120310 Transcript_38528/m.120310 type:complete len:222 (+) Transcript_38528:321-986(+)
MRGLVKLPLIFTDSRLYAGAIANFYFLTEALEACLDRSAAAEPKGLVAELRARFALRAAAGYEADLAQLFGAEWRERAAAARTPATEAYCAVLHAASPVELVAAAFILYGALVVGGGKSTQRKVRRVFPSCEHKLFDISDNMVEARKQFKVAFNELAEAHPEHEESLVSGAARFMSLNNTVVISIRCLPFFWWQAAAASAVLAAVSIAWMRGRKGLTQAAV